MSRWIDADALKQNLKENYTFYGFVDLLNDFYVAVDEAPSIDIVRCAECKYWRNTDAEKIPTANIMCGHMHSDDFCSYGERRE